MALNTTGTATLSDEMKTYYDRLLLVRTVPVLLHARFGQKRRIPMHGGKTVEFRRFAGLATATTPLTEGALYTALKDLTVTAITATIAQYGNAVGFSDLVATTTFDPILSETTEILGENAGQTIDELVRDVLVAGTAVIYAGAATSRGTVASSHTLGVAEIREAVLTLKLGRAKKIDGFFHAIVHPRVAFDIQATSEWISANQYAGSQRIFSGALGTLYGVMFWESDVTKVFVDAGVGSTVDVYVSLFFGRDAYGVIDLAGHNLESIYKAKGSAGTADPLSQQQTMGWKVAFVTKILNDAFMVRVESSTSTGAN